MINLISFKLLSPSSLVEYVIFTELLPLPIREEKALSYVENTMFLTFGKRFQIEVLKTDNVKVISKSLIG